MLMLITYHEAAYMTPVEQQFCKQSLNILNRYYACSNILMVILYFCLDVAFS